MDYVYHVLVMVCLYAILAISFNVVIGLAGLFALSHAAFYAIGAYTTAILTTQYGVPVLPALVCGIVLTGVIGAIAALPALRIGGHYLVVVTLALQIIVIDVLRNAQGLTGGPDGISGIPRLTLFGQTLSTPGSFLVLAAAVAAFVYLITHMLAFSPFGRALRAMREDELAAQSIGKNVVALKLIAFAFSAASAAIAGSLLAHYITFVSPQSFSIDETILVLAMIILGGTGNLLGAVAGAAILVVLPELLKLMALPVGTADLLRNAFYGLMLILILRFRPEGIFPERYRYRLPESAKRAAGVLEVDAWTRPVRGEVTLAGNDLHKNFGGIVAANGVDLELRSGIVTGLIGPNGAGKTTAFNLLTGFLTPTAGRVSMRGLPLADRRPHRIVRSSIARSFQDLRLFKRMTVLENVLTAFPDQLGDRLWNVFLRPFAVRAQDHANMARALEVLDFVGLRDRAEQSADNLSYAEEKLLVIARLLATDAEVLLLDEPLSGLDPTTLDQVLPIVRRLAEQGRTICLIEHNLDVIREVCDVTAYLDGGKVLAFGKPEELMRDPKLVERYIQ